MKDVVVGDFYYREEELCKLVLYDARNTSAWHATALVFVFVAHSVFWCAAASLLSYS